MAFAGAGLWELALLSALLAREGTVLVLDEPALNLHPAGQGQLLSKLLARQGQTVLITHSPYLVPGRGPEDLSRVVRFVLEGGRTCGHPYRPPEDEDLKEKTVRFFSPSAEVRALLFAGGVVLVEGDAELGALPVWLEKDMEAGLRPTELNVVFHNVGGYVNFQYHIALLKAWEIPWALLVDGRALDPKARDWIFEQVRKAAGKGEAADLERLRRLRAETDEADAQALDHLMAKLKEAGRLLGIFSLATAFKKESGQVEDFMDFLEREISAESIAQARQEANRSEVIQAALVARKTPCPSKIKEIYKAMLVHMGLIRADEAEPHVEGPPPS